MRLNARQRNQSRNRQWLASISSMYDFNPDQAPIL